MIQKALIILCIIVYITAPSQGYQGMYIVRICMQGLKFFFEIFFFLLLFPDCQGTFFPECQKRIRAQSKEVGRIECWGKPLYAYCIATDGTIFLIPGYVCRHSTCPTAVKHRHSIWG